MTAGVVVEQVGGRPAGTPDVNCLPMSDASAFSPDYIAARARFRSSTLAVSGQLESHPIGQAGPDGEELTIDTAIWGEPNPERVVILSSGLHGVEGFFGSAVQAAVLEDRLGGFSPPPRSAVVLLHALNPYGFANLRRVNEENADLNRNFLLPEEPFAGAPAGYARLDGLLNPKNPPRWLDPFLLRAVPEIVRRGLPTLKDAVAGGQYEFPQGLFFGGRGPSRTQSVLREFLPRVCRAAARVVHVDFHTGLGRRGDYKLLVGHEHGSPGVAWLSERFGANAVQPWEPGGVSYRIRGGLGGWCKKLFPGCEYDVLAAEFGTVPVLKVISALRSENQAHHWGRPDHSSTIRAKEALREVFAPSDRRWRDQVVAKGLKIVDQAIEAAFEG
jgi:hypothetical protein